METINDLIPVSLTMDILKDLATELDISDKAVQFHDNFTSIDCSKCEDREKIFAFISFAFNECRMGHIEIKMFEFGQNKEFYLSGFIVINTRKNTLELIVNNEWEMKKINEALRSNPFIKIKKINERGETDEINGIEHVFITMEYLKTIVFH